MKDDVTDAFKGQIWYIPELKKVIMLGKVKHWDIAEHKTKLSKKIFAMINKSKSSTPDDTSKPSEKNYVVCYPSHRGSKYLHIYTASCGIKIETATIIDWYISEGQRKAKVGEFFDKNEKTKLSNSLGFGKTGEESMLEIKYIGHISSF
ncbi:MAG TPA: hypothetical protein PLZ62_00025 [bacterium]|nr:hypothetical protein [bacterium]